MPAGGAQGSPGLLYIPDDLVLHLLDRSDRLLRRREHLVGDRADPFPSALAGICRSRPEHETPGKHVRFELVTVLQAELHPDLVKKRDGQFAIADAGFRHSSFPQRYGTSADTALSNMRPRSRTFSRTTGFSSPDRRAGSRNLMIMPSSALVRPRTPCRSISNRRPCAVPALSIASASPTPR